MSLGGPWSSMVFGQTCHEVHLSKYLLRPAEGTLNISTLLGEQVQMMQKHSVHPTSGSLAGFLFEIHKNIEHMDCATGFYLERNERV